MDIERAVEYEQVEQQLELRMLTAIAGAPCAEQSTFIHSDDSAIVGLSRTTAMLRACSKLMFHVKHLKTPCICASFRLYYKNRGGVYHEKTF